MSKDIEKPSGGHVSPFERIRRTSEAGGEYWSSRDFATVLEYGDYRNFEGVIEKAKLSCFNSGHRIDDHFVDVTDMIGIGKGLYGGMDAKDIHQHKGLKKSQKILDHMGSTELAANLFRATQTEEKIRRENVQGKSAANETHRKVGAKVRQTIKELGGTMPENLPSEDSIKKLEMKQRKNIKNQKE